MWQWWKCLNCGHVWYSGIEPDRCGGGCKSYWVMPEQKYLEILDNLDFLIKQGTPIWDHLITLFEILGSQGVILQPARTLKLLHRLIDDARRIEKIREKILRR